MTKPVRTLIVTLLVIGSPWVSAADESPKIEPPATIPGSISLEEALDHAFRSSPKIRKSEAMMEVANQEWIRARSVFLPKLDLVSTTQNIEALGGLPGLESLLLSGRNDVYHSVSSVRLGLNIYNGGADAAGLRLADEKILEAKLQWQVQRAAIALVVLDHLHVVRQAGIELRIAQLQRELSTKRLEQAGTSLSVGRMSTIEHSEVKYNFRNKDLSTVARARAYRNALQNLARVIGIVENATPQALGVSEREDGYDVVLTRRNLVSISGDREVYISESRTRQAQMEAKRAKSGYLPKVDLFARREYAAISESSYQQAFNDQRKDKNLVGFTLTWNLFDGLRTTAEVSAAAQRVVSAEADQDILLEDRRKEVADLDRLLKDSEEDRQIEEQRLDLLRTKLEISREKLALGRLSTLEFNAVQTEWEEQKLQLELRVEKVAYHRAKLLLRRVE